MYFSHKCSQLSWCRALNVEVMVTFYIYFLYSLFALLWCLPWCPAFGCRWTTKASWGAIVRWAPRTMGLSVSHPRISIHMFSLNEHCLHVWLPRTPSTYQALIGKWMGLCPSLDWTYGLHFVFGSLPSTITSRHRPMQYLGIDNYFVIMI